MSRKNRKKKIKKVKNEIKNISNTVQQKTTEQALNDLDVLFKRLLKM